MASESEVWSGTITREDDLEDYADGVPTWRAILHVWTGKIRANCPLLRIAEDIGHHQRVIVGWAMKNAAENPQKSSLEVIAESENIPVFAFMELAARQAEFDREFARLLPGPADAPPLDLAPGALLVAMAEAWAQVDYVYRRARTQWERGELAPGQGVPVPAKPVLERHCVVYEAMLEDLVAGKRRQRTPQRGPGVSGFSWAEQ
jgi:hypothetical protein